MRVTAQSNFTAVIQGGQMLDVKAGDEFTGDVAAYLLRTGADVVEAGEQDEEPEKSETPEVEGSAGASLNIDGKIDDVLEWVGDDKARALEAHAAEEAKGDKARPRLLGKLTELIEA